MLYALGVCFVRSFEIEARCWLVVGGAQTELVGFHAALPHERRNGMEASQCKSYSYIALPQWRGHKLYVIRD